MADNPFAQFGPRLAAPPDNPFAQFGPRLVDNEMPQALPRNASPMDYAIQSMNASQNVPTPLDTYLEQQRQKNAPKPQPPRDPSKPPTFGEKYAELVEGIPAFFNPLAKAVGQAITAPYDPNAETVGEKAHYSISDQIAAGTQRTAPHTRDNEGQFLRKPLGRAVQGDDGKWYYDPDPSNPQSQYLPVIQNKHVVLRDPDTGLEIAFERDAKHDENMMTSLGRVVLPFMATSNVTRLPGGIQPARQIATRAAQQEPSLVTRVLDRIAPTSETPRAVPTPPAPPRSMQEIQTNRYREALRDLDAFAETGVRPSLPVVSEAPLSSVAMQLSETPFVGGPMRNALAQSVNQTRDAAERIAGNLTNLRTIPEAGTRVQQGLDRFRTARINELTPDVLQNLGIVPTQQTRRAEQMSEGAINSIAEANRLRQQANANVGPQNIRGNFRTPPPVPPGPQPPPVPPIINQRRTAADMSIGELTTIARASARQTSFAARQEALYELADRNLPTIMRTDGSRNPNRVALFNTRQEISGILRQEAAASIQGGVAEGGRFGRLVERLSNPQAHMSLEEIRAARTEIGRALSNFGTYDARLDRTQLKRLYGAFTQDLENGYRTIAARAWQRTRSNGLDRVDEAVARAADQALYQFQRASRYTRVGMERMDRFMTVLDAKTPEQAAVRLRQAALSKGRGNIELLRTARAALRDEEWNDFAGVMLNEIGHPVASATGRAREAGFSVRTAATNYQNMTPEARQLLWGGSREVDSFFRVVGRLAEIEATVNSSRSTTNFLNVTGTIGSLAAVASGQALTALSVGIGAFGLSYILSRPYLVRLMTFALRNRAMHADANSGTMIERAFTESNRGLQQLATALARDKEAPPELVQAIQQMMLPIRRATDGRQPQSENRQPQPRVQVLQR